MGRKNKCVYNIYKKLEKGHPLFHVLKYTLTVLSFPSLLENWQVAVDFHFDVTAISINCCGSHVRRMGVRAYTNFISKVS